ncbi:MAG: response regulator, partial [Planctomycetes bacterium]|nr:response regulator [Planctomycetota bacterium]
LIRAAGLKVKTYLSGQLFLDDYDPNQPGCLILDVRMPDMSGLDLQKILIDKKSDLPVIIMTGYADEPIAVESMKLGAMFYLEKPFSEKLIYVAFNRPWRSALKFLKENLTRRLYQLLNRYPNNMIIPSSKSGKILAVLFS